MALTAAQLEGLPPDFVSGLPSAESAEGDVAPGGERRLSVGLKAPQLGPVLQMGRDPAARRAALVASQGRCAAVNGPRLEELVALRHTKAQALGFESHAHFMLDGKVAKTPARAVGFLEEVVVDKNRVA